MNKFVKSEYDQFNKKKVISLKDEIKLDATAPKMMLLSSEIGFRQVTIKDNPSILVMDFIATSLNGLNISNGELQMIVDGEHYSFAPNQSFSDPYLSNYHIESDWYEINEAYLKSICDAKTLAVRVTNGNEYADLSSLEKMQWGARVMYNALFDKTAYVNEILAVSNLKEQQEYVEKYKSKLIWTWVIGIVMILIGWWSVDWWLIVIGIIAIGIFQFWYSKKKNDILNSTALE